MTYTEYRSIVSQIRYQFSYLSKFIIEMAQYGILVRNNKAKQVFKKIGLYLQVLEQYELPAKIVATSSTGDYTLTLAKSIDPTNYIDYLDRVITGEGIPDNTRILRISTTEIVLSKECTSTNNKAIYTLGLNCISLADFSCIIGDINKTFGLALCSDGYYTDFDLIQEVIVVNPSWSSLLYGSSPEVLTGANMVANTVSDISFSGEDTSILFNFSWEYAYFAYPATYPDLLSILDQEGDDVLASGAFTKSIMDIDFIWGTIQYKVYKTDWVTSIPNETYQFKF